MDIARASVLTIRELVGREVSGEAQPPAPAVVPQPDKAQSRADGQETSGAEGSTVPSVADLTAAFEAGQQCAVFLNSVHMLGTPSVLKRPTEYWLDQATRFLSHFDEVLEKCATIRTFRDWFSDGTAIDFAGQSAPSFHEAVLITAVRLRRDIDLELGKVHLDAHHEGSGDGPYIPYGRPDTLEAVWTEKSWETLQAELRKVPTFDFDRLVTDLACERIRAARRVDRNPQGGDRGSTDAENSIRLEGEVWRLRFQRESGDFPDRGNKCLRYLMMLLAKPNRSFTVAELIGDPERKLAAEAEFGSECQDDAAGIRAKKGRLEEIEALPPALQESEAIIAEKADLLIALKEGLDKKQMESPLKKAHHNIASQFRTFRQKLKKKMPLLAAHLTALKLDYPHFGYYPPTGTLPWKI
jgi:hypothetical protein